MSYKISGYPYPPIVGGRAINPYREPDRTNSTKVTVRDNVRAFTEKLHDLRAFEEWSFQAAKKRFLGNSEGASWSAHSKR